MFFYLIVVPFLNIYLFSKGLFLFFPKFINLNEKYFFFCILMFMNIISFGGQVQPKHQTSGSNPLQKQSENMIKAKHIKSKYVLEYILEDSSCIALKEQSNFP